MFILHSYYAYVVGNVYNKCVSGASILHLFARAQLILLHHDTLSTLTPAACKFELEVGWIMLSPYCIPLTMLRWWSQHGRWQWQVKY
jgi:hypothetical protein